MNAGDEPPFGFAFTIDSSCNRQWVRMGLLRLHISGSPLFSSGGGHQVSRTHKDGGACQTLSNNTIYLCNTAAHGSTSLLLADVLGNWPAAASTASLLLPGF